MGYDLYLWPADRAFTWAEADAERERRDGGWRIGLGHDKRLDPFLAALRRRYPGIGEGPDGLPVELDVHRRHLSLGIGWSVVEELVPVISQLAHETGLAVVDPQRELVGLPAPLAAEPLGRRVSTTTSGQPRTCSAPSSPARQPGHRSRSSCAPSAQR